MVFLSFANYQNILDKCNYELQRLDTCSKHPEYDYLIFNIVFGLNPLYEWAIKDPEISTNLKARIIEEFNPYRCYQDVNRSLKKYYNEECFPQINEYQEVIRKLCNNAKHFNKKTIEQQRKNYTCGAGEAGMQAGEPKALAGTFDHYKYYVDISGVEVELTTVLASLVECWKITIENA